MAFVKKKLKRLLLKGKWTISHLYHDEDRLLFDENNYNVCFVLDQYTYLYFNIVTTLKKTDNR